MVSGLVTSPWDQFSICSGDAMEIRIALKFVPESSVVSAILTIKSSPAPGIDRFHMFVLVSLEAGFPHSITQPLGQGFGVL